METNTINKDKYHIGIKEIIGIFIGFFLFRMMLYWIYSALFWGLKITYINIKELNSYSYILIDIISYIVIIRMYTKKTNSKIKLNVYREIYVYIYFMLIFLGYMLCYNNTIEILIEKFCRNSWYNKVGTQQLRSSISYFIHCVIVAPIFEEIYNRGIILDCLLKNSKPVTAIFISAILFSLGHLNIVQIPNAFFMGIILGVAYYKTQSLWTGILIHIINNLISTICLYFPSVFNNNKFSAINLFIGSLILILCIYMHKNNKINKILKKHI